MAREPLVNVFQRTLAVACLVQGALSVRLDQVQWLGTHNSFHTPNPVLPEWNYGYSSLDVQVSCRATHCTRDIRLSPDVGRFFRGRGLCCFS